MASEDQLYSALSDDLTVSGLVDDRIYSDIRDQGDTLPAIYYERASTEFYHTMDSFTVQAEKASFVLSCFDATREATEALTDAVIAALSTNGFLSLDKQNSFDDESEIFSTTIQVNHLKTN